MPARHRPAFALERLRQIDPEHLVYERVKPGPGGSVSLILTPLELIDRLVALIPPPRRHRHRYYGVLAAPRLVGTAKTKTRVGAGRGTTRARRLKAGQIRPALSLRAMDLPG
jgi:hypothetical protein